MNEINDTKVTANEWVDYLMQIDMIESYAEYAEMVLGNLGGIASELADQPCDTPDAEELIRWAIDYTARRQAAVKLGSISTPKKAASSAANGKLGGRPKLDTKR